MWEFAGAIATVASTIAAGTAMFATATGLWAASAEIGGAGILACATTGITFAAAAQVARIIRRALRGR